MSRDHGSEDTVGTNILEAIPKWIPTCLALAIVVSSKYNRARGKIAYIAVQTSLPIQVAAIPSNFGKYDSFLYKDWRYPLEARNKFENKNDQQEIEPRFQTQPTLGKIERLVGPKYLCFLGANDRIEWSAVSDWTERNEKTTNPSYVFVSFTGTHFSSKADLTYLSDVGRHAAKSIGVSGYWISSSCLINVKLDKDKCRQEIKQEREESIWSMSDIIRGASAIVIAVPGPLDAQYNGTSLKEWGDRVWTMPELLLYTGSHPVLVYERTKDLHERRSLPRRDLWSKVWSDTHLSGQLIDHYENSLTLSPLELVTVALQCFHNRSTTSYLAGDISYILMGILRQRPQVVGSDTAFQAFARLSLANDSNSLLERLICLLPKSLDAEWWSFEDVWNVMLWDIDPEIQICGLGDDDTVVLDGARGAAIRWDQFIPVLTLGEETLRHRFSRWILRTVPGLFIVGLIWIIAVSAVEFPRPFLIPGIVLCGFSSLVVLLSPYLTRLIYSVQIHDSQPLFFGFEGYVNIYRLELLIFGSYEGRLRWSTAGSPLSRHALDRNVTKENNMYIGLDPVVTDAKIKKLVEQATDSKKKIFTLVDTYTMTVTLFEAVRPPVAVILCGREGGMQRALLCSEDWTSGTVYRETVIRMETRVWDKMNTLARVRLGLKRTESGEMMEVSKKLIARKKLWWKNLVYSFTARI